MKKRRWIKKEYKEIKLQRKKKSAAVEKVGEKRKRNQDPTEKIERIEEA